jgi:hypothetical protein
MTSHICSVVPPYLLRGIIEGLRVSQAAEDDEARQCAQHTLDHRAQYIAKRCDRFSTLSQPRAARAQSSTAPQQGIVPEILLKHIADSEDVDEETRTRARADIERTQRVISAYQKVLAPEQEDEGAKTGEAATSKPKGPKPSGFYRAVHDAKNSPDEEDLPGTIVRVEGQKPIKDETANDAYDNVGKVLEFYLKKFDWKSIDNKNMHVVSTVHFGEGYENAFWDPTRMQMVFGDGDKFLHRFASCLDVIGHELTVSETIVSKSVETRTTDWYSTPSPSTPALSSMRVSPAP